MKRATFQIEPTAKFTAGRPNAKVNALAERLFGRTRGTHVDLGILFGSPVARHSAPSSAALRKRSPQDALKIQDDRFAAQPPTQVRKPPRVEAPTGFRRAARPFPLRMVDAACEYRGFLISTTQGSDGSWTASFARKGQESVTLPRRFSTTHPARFLAVADAELEIDELAGQ